MNLSLAHGEFDGLNQHVDQPRRKRSQQPDRPTADEEADADGRADAAIPLSACSDLRR